MVSVKPNNILFYFILMTCVAHFTIIIIYVMELGHLFTHSGLTYPEVSSKVCHNFFCQLGNNVSFPWVICYETFYLHVVSSVPYIPVICPELVLFLIPTYDNKCYINICPVINCYTSTGILACMHASKQKFNITYVLSNSTNKNKVTNLVTQQNKGSS